MHRWNMQFTDQPAKPKTSSFSSNHLLLLLFPVCGHRLQHNHAPHKNTPLSVVSCRYDAHHRHYNAGPLGALLLVTPSSDYGDVDDCSLADGYTYSNEEQQQLDSTAQAGTNSAPWSHSSRYTNGQGSGWTSQQQQQQASGSVRIGKRNIKVLSSFVPLHSSQPVSDGAEQQPYIM